MLNMQSSKQSVDVRTSRPRKRMLFFGGIKYLPFFGLQRNETGLRSLFVQLLS